MHLRFLKKLPNWEDKIERTIYFEQVMKRAEAAKKHQGFTQAENWSSI